MTKSSKKEREYDHSSHPTTHRTPDDLSAPGEESVRGPYAQEDDINQPAVLSDEHQDSKTEDRARETRIAELAYERAHHRGFAPGYELDDWLAAETEWDNALSESTRSNDP